MKIRDEGRVPAGTGSRLTKGNRQSVADSRPGTVGEESGHVQRDDTSRMVASPASRNDDEWQLVASLRELVSLEGPVKAAEALGVGYRTVMRAIETKTLTKRMEDALKLRQLEAGGAVAEPVLRRLDALERRQEELEAGLLMLAREVGAKLAEVSGNPGELRDALPARDRAGHRGGPGEPAGGQDAQGEAAGGRTPATTAVAAGAPQAVIGWPQRVDRLPLGHPEVVTLEPLRDEALDYAEAAPLVIEWRQARAAFLSQGATRVERARGRVRMCELELLLIGDHELTLPPSKYPWDESRRHDELFRRNFVLVSARWELVQALFWSWVWRVLTLRLWWR